MEIDSLRRTTEVDEYRGIRLRIYPNIFIIFYFFLDI